MPGIVNRSMHRVSIILNHGTLEDAAGATVGVGMTLPKVLTDRPRRLRWASDRSSSHDLTSGQSNNVAASSPAPFVL